MFRWEKESGDLATQGESHPGVRLCESVYGMAGLVGIAMRSPRSRARGEVAAAACSGFFPPPSAAGLQSSLRANAEVVIEGVRKMLDRFSGRGVEGSAPNKSDASIGRRRVNGNQRCSPLGPAGNWYDGASE